MPPVPTSRLSQVLSNAKDDLAAEWLGQLTSSGAGRDGRVSADELRSRTDEFVRLLSAAARNGGTDPDRPAGKELREFLVSLSGSRARAGFTSEETASFVFSLKGPLFARLRAELGRDSEALAEETLLASQLLDKLGLATVGAFQTSREELIRRQQEDMLELSTPVVKLWDGELALPMVGTRVLPTEE